MKEKIPTFTALAVEIFSIVVSILLALGVNKWRENQKNAQLVSEEGELIG